MANEITAEMLACKMSELNGTGSGPGWEEEAGVFLLATRAFASLQAERAKDAPERVRCWMLPGHRLFTDDWETAESWRDGGDIPIRGWFTPDTKGSTDD